jgi:hypothetical protein
VNGAKLEHGLGAGKAPARTGDSEPILDQVAAGALDDAGGDGQSLGEELRVAHERGVPGEVLDAFVDGLSLLLAEVAGSDGALNVGDDGLDRMGQELEQEAHDPGLGFDGILAAEREACGPRGS